jgi:type III pantothenate kinase
MLVVIDIGNTSIKFGVFDGDRLVAVERIAGGVAGQTLFPTGPVASASEVVAISSSPASTAGLVEKLGRPVRLLGDDVRRAVATTYGRPEDLGLDRIAAAWGGRALSGRVPLVVADVGTAVTVDAIDAAGRFVAGAIAPGIAAARDGLVRAAPHLPVAWAAEGDVALPARGTAASLRAGFLLGFAGLLDRLLDEVARASGGAAAAVVTGGGAPPLLPHLRTPHVHEPHAVLRGIVELHRAVPA